MLEEIDLSSGSMRKRQSYIKMLKTYTKCKQYSGTAEWIFSHCKQDVKYYGVHLYFQNPDEALLYKIKFGE